MMGIPESIKGYQQCRFKFSLADYTHLSKFFFFLFSIANQTIVPRMIVMIHPVIPGPVAKFASKKPLKPLLEALPKSAKLRMCAIVWMTLKKANEKPVALWNVML